MNINFFLKLLFVEPMDCNIINLVYRMGGRWVYSDSLEYIECAEVFENGNIDYLSITHMTKKYKVEFVMPNVNKLCYVKLGKSLDDVGVIFLENDDGINDIVALILELDYKSFIHIYPFEETVLKQPNLGTQCSATVGMDFGVGSLVIDFGAGSSGMDFGVGSLVTYFGAGSLKMVGGSMVSDKGKKANG